LPEGGRDAGAAIAGVPGCGAERVVAHDGPDAESQDPSGRGRADQRRAPADRIDDHGQGRLAQDPAGHARHHGQARNQGEAPRREPAAGQGQGTDEAEGGTDSDHQAPQMEPAERVREREAQAAEGAERGGGRQHPARPPTVDGHADRDLQARVGVEIERREIAQHRRADAQVAHQGVDHDAGRDPVKKGVGEQQRGR